MWHWLLVAPALLVLIMGIVFPVWLGTVGTLVALVIGWGGAHMERLRLGDTGTGVVLGWATLLVGAALLAAVIAELRVPRPSLPPPGDGPRFRAWTWIWKHPWWAFGGCLGVACVAVVPSFDAYSSPSFPLLAATTAIATSLWASLTVTWLCFRAARFAVTASWRMAVASQFLAGMLVMGAVATTVGWMGVAVLVGARVQELADRLEARQRLQRSSPPQLGSGLSTASTADELFSDGSGSGLTGSALGSCMESTTEPLRQAAANVATRYVAPDEALDVIRQVLINLCVKGIIPSQRPGYFVNSVRNLAADWYRGRWRECSVDVLPEPACEAGSDASGLPSEANQTLRTVWCRLRAGDQQILTLRYLEELSYPEIGRRLGISADAARQQGHRAEIRLRTAYFAVCR